MAEVLVAHNYFLDFDPAERDAMRPWAPLGPLHAAASLRRSGHDVGFWDATFARAEDEFQRALVADGPRVVVLMADAFNVPQKMCLRRMRAAAFAMIAAARARSARVVVAGPDAASYPGEYLQAGAHAVIPGEAEAVLDDLVPRWLAGQGPDDVPGLVVAGPGGAPAATAERRRIRALDDLPPPARDLIDMDRYLRAWRRRHGHGWANVVTSRGCPYPCNWCAKPVYGRRYTQRGPESVAAEIRELKDRYGVERVWFADEVFGLERGWLGRWRQALEQQQVQIPYEALSRVDLLDDTVAADLRATGCFSLWMGAESGSQRVLDAMEKGSQVEDIGRARAALERQGIEVGFFLQFGYPGERMEDIDATIAMVRHLLPDRIGISVSYPLPGTPFYERVRDQQGVGRGWQVSMENELLHTSTYSADFYKTLRRVVHKEFLVSQSARALRRDLARVARGDLRSLGRVPRILWQKASATALRARLKRQAVPVGPPTTTA